MDRPYDIGTPERLLFDAAANFEEAAKNNEVTAASRNVDACRLKGFAAENRESARRCRAALAKISREI